MTQSNKTFRKSSLHSWTAALLALLALAGCGALWIVVGQLEQEFGSLIRDRAGYEQRLQEIRAEVAAEERKRGQVWDHRQQLRSDTAEAEATLAQLRAQANAVEETKGTLEADLLGLEDALAARQAQLDAALASIDEAARLEDRIADLRRQSQTLTKAVTAAEQDHDDVQAALSAAESQRARLNAEVADAEGDLARVKDQLAARQDDVEGLKAEIVGLEALRAEKAGLEATLAELKDDRAKLDRALAALTQEVETLQLAADDIGPRVVGFRTDRDQLREEVAQARADLATARSARQLAEQQQLDAERAKDTADRDICLLAILLHDIGWYAIDIERILDEAFTGENMLQTDVRYLHESEGVRMAGPVLAQTGFGHLTAPVCDIIDGHDTRPEPRDLNDRIVRDADKLWRFEVAGIAICCDWMKMTPHAYADRLEQKILPRLETQAAQTLAADQLARSRAALRLDVI